MSLPSILLPLETGLLSIDADSVRSRGARGDPKMELSAVMVLFYPRDDSASFLLTERPGDLSRHPGQISLPGGRAEAGDASLWHTALRETREELGIRTGRIRTLGRLHPVQLNVSGYVIHPFVAWSPVPPRLRPDPGEVAAVIEVPAATLLDVNVVVEEEWLLRGSYWLVTYYKFREHRIWGATARIMSELAGLLQEEPAWRDFAPGSVRTAPRRSAGT
jgi:8-oxo-dGTP pyrophosphatase MutT (NUDIX family)